MWGDVVRCGEMTHLAHALVEVGQAAKAKEVKPFNALSEHRVNQQRAAVEMARERAAMEHRE